MPYKRVREQKIIFFFKYADQHPEFLHIYVRHLTEIDDALDTFLTQTSRAFGTSSASDGRPNR